MVAVEHLVTLYRRQFANGDPVAAIEAAYPSLTGTQIDMRSILTSDHLTPSVARYLPVPTGSTLGFGFPLRGITPRAALFLPGVPLALPRRMLLGTAPLDDQQDCATPVRSEDSETGDWLPMN